MKVLLLALALAACTIPPVEVPLAEAPVDDARLLQEELYRAVDSLQAVDPCRRAWSEPRQDSVWRCPDPPPPAFPDTIGAP
jgi:hypothetical protein